MRFTAFPQMQQPRNIAGERGHPYNTHSAASRLSRSPPALDDARARAPRYIGTLPSKRFAARRHIYDAACEGSSTGMLIVIRLLAAALALPFVLRGQEKVMERGGEQAHRSLQQRAHKWRYSRRWSRSLRRR